MGLQSIFGIPIYIEPRRPRYTLPADVPPPPGMTRGEFAAWSIKWCGYAKPILADGQVVKLPQMFHMNRRTWDLLDQAVLAQQQGRP